MQKKLNKNWQAHNNCSYDWARL